MNKFKENINVIELVDAFVKRVNTQFKESGAQRIMEVAIKKSTRPLKVDRVITNEEKGGKINTKKEGRAIYVYLHNLETNERLVLFTSQFFPKNPSEILTSGYKRQLYIELLYNCFGIFAVNMEDVIISRRLAQLEKGLENNPLANYPVTPNEVVKTDTDI